MVCLDRKSKFINKFGHITCPCCKIDILSCCDIQKSSILTTEFLSCYICNFTLFFNIDFNNNISYLFGLKSYYASNDDYNLFFKRRRYISRIINNLIKKW